MPSLYIGEQPVRTVALASNNDDATAVAADVMKDKIAYNQYGKIVGTAKPAENLDSEMTAQDSLIEQIKSAVASKASISYPTLSNPASAGNIESGYQAIGQDGSIIEGSLQKIDFVTGTFDNPSSGTSMTIPDLIGKNNFIVAAYSCSYTTGSTPVAMYINGSLKFSPANLNHGSYNSPGSFDSSTGTITCESFAGYTVKFIYGTHYYVAW